MAIEAVKGFVRDEIERKRAAVLDSEMKVAEKVRQFVQNGRTAVLHAMALAGPLVPPLKWITRCGWRFAARLHSLLAAVPGDLPWRSMCDRCLPHNHSEARLQEQSSDGDRSDEGSSERRHRCAKNVPIRAAA